jgi:hypothetical protein
VVVAVVAAAETAGDSVIKRSRMSRPSRAAFLSSICCRSEARHRGDLGQFLGIDSTIG